jgi:hypothetical protein
MGCPGIAAICDRTQEIALRKDADDCLTVQHSQGAYALGTHLGSSVAQGLTRVAAHHRRSHQLPHDGAGGWMVHSPYNLHRSISLTLRRCVSEGTLTSSRRAIWPLEVRASGSVPCRMAGVAFLS